MTISQSNKFKDVFSFKRGLLSIFGIKERRLDTARRIILSRSNEEAIREDFIKVGEDMYKAMRKSDKKKEIPELHECL